MGVGGGPGWKKRRSTGKRATRGGGGDSIDFMYGGGKGEN